MIEAARALGNICRVPAIARSPNGKQISEAMLNLIQVRSEMVWERLFSWIFSIFSLLKFLENHIDCICTQDTNETRNQCGLIILHGLVNAGHDISRVCYISFKAAIASG